MWFRTVWGRQRPAAVCKPATNGPSHTGWCWCRACCGTSSAKWCVSRSELCARVRRRAISEHRSALRSRLLQEHGLGGATLHPLSRPFENGDSDSDLGLADMTSYYIGYRPDPTGGGAAPAGVLHFARSRRWRSCQISAHKPVLAVCILFFLQLTPSCYVYQH